MDPNYTYVPDEPSDKSKVLVSSYIDTNGDGASDAVEFDAGGETWKIAWSSYRLGDDSILRNGLHQDASVAIYNGGYAPSAPDWTSDYRS